MKWTPSRTQKSVAVGAVVILAIAAIAILGQSRGSGRSWGEALFSLSSPVIGPGNSTKDTKTTTPSVSPAAETAPVDYGTAIKEYEGRRFQFVGCNGTPGTMIIVLGTSVLLDNRGEAKISVVVGSRSYSIDAYGYAVATPTETGDLPITCNGSGAATLSVQPS